MKPPALFVLPLLLVTLEACFGRTVPSPGTDTTAAGTQPGAASGTDPGGASGATTSGATVANVATRCEAPHGAPVKPVTPAAFSRGLVGRWLGCQYDPNSISSLITHEGVEFTADGRYYGLESDGQGGLQRATKLKVVQFQGYPATVEPSGSYSIYSRAAEGLVSGDDDRPTQIMHLHLNEIILDLEVSFEASPRRFLTTNGIAMWFVSADPEPNDPTPRLADVGELCGPDDGQCRSGLQCALVFPQPYPGTPDQGVCKNLD